MRQRVEIQPPVILAYAAAYLAAVQRQTRSCSERVVIPPSEVGLLLYRIQVIRGFPLRVAEQVVLELAAEEEAQRALTTIVRLRHDSVPDDVLLQTARRSKHRRTEVARERVTAFEGVLNQVALELERGVQTHLTQVTQMFRPLLLEMRVDMLLDLCLRCEASLALDALVYHCFGFRLLTRTYFILLDT